MLFTSLWFICCTMLLAAVVAIPYGLHPAVGIDVSRNVKQVAQRRQAQPWKNETISATPDTTTLLASSASSEVMSSLLQEVTTTMSRSEIVISMTSTLTPSSSYSTSILSTLVLKPSPTGQESLNLPTVHTISVMSTQVGPPISQASASPSTSRQYISSSVQLSWKQESETGVSNSDTNLFSNQHTSTFVPTTTQLPISGGDHLPTQSSISSLQTSAVDVQNSPNSHSGIPSESHITSFNSRLSSILPSIESPPQAASSQTTSLLAAATTRHESSIQYGNPFVPAASSSAPSAEASEARSTTLLITVTVTSRPESSKVEQPLLFTPSLVASGDPAALRPSSAPSQIDSSTTAVLVVSRSLFVASATPVMSTLAQSLVTGTPLPVSSSATISPSFIPASESLSLSSLDPTFSPVLASKVPSGVFFPSSSGTAISSSTPEATQTRTTTHIEGSTRALVTSSLVSESVNGSTYGVFSTTPAFSQISDIEAPVRSASSLYNHMTATNVSPLTLATPIASANLTTQPRGSGALTVSSMTSSSLLHIGTGSAISIAYHSPTTQHGWNNTLFLVSAASPTTLRPTLLATGVSYNSNATYSGAVASSHLPTWSNSSSTYPVANDTLPISDASHKPIASSPTSTDAGISSVLASLNYGTGPATSVSATRASTSSASATATAAPPPPLTTSQTAGVAIAGTTGLLIAIVAAVYMARRHHARKARRSSTGSAYPKVAYLYDPPTGNSDDEDRSYMSGGISGVAVQESASRAPPDSPQRSQRYSTGMLPLRYSDPGNPFRDPEGLMRHSNGSLNRTPAGAAAALSAAIRGYTATSQSSPNLATFPEHASPCDVGYGMSKLDHSNIGDLSPSRSSILSEIASIAYGSQPLPNAATLRYQPLSPHGRHENYSLPCVRETMYTDPFRDPFEHDLLLQVDTRTETPDSVTVYAPGPQATVMKPIKLLSKNPWASSVLTPITTQGTPRPHSRLAEGSPISLDATIVVSERFSLVYDNTSSTTYIAPSQNQAYNTISPISPAKPTHRGWDDIKRYSADKVVPSSIISLSAPLRHDSPPPLKKKSLPQLRRKEVALSTSPSSLKVPFTHHKTLSVDGHKYSPSAKLDAARHGHYDLVRNPNSHFSHGVQSLAGMVHKKRSADLDFACAGV